LAELLGEVSALETEREDLAWERWNALSVLEQGRVILRYQNQRPPTEEQVTELTEEQARRSVEYWKKHDTERGTEQLRLFASYLIRPEESRSYEQRRVAIVEQISTLGEVAAPALIDEVMRQGPYVQDACEGLRGMGPVAVPFVLGALEDAANDQVRSGLMNSFGRTDDPKVRRVLLDALGDPSAQVRREALSALERQGPVSQETYLRCLKDEDWKVREIAIRGLERIGNTRAIPALEEVSANDPATGKGQYYLRRIAGQAIEAIRGREGNEARDWTGE
jgi:hypothetical protein